MNQPDFEGAKLYALRRLQDELAPELYYHNLTHTWDDVLPAASQVAALSGIREEEMRLLEVAVAFHDIGFVVQRDEHELVSCQIASLFLYWNGMKVNSVFCKIIAILPKRLGSYATRAKNRILLC